MLINNDPIPTDGEIRTELWPERRAFLDAVDTAGRAIDMIGIPRTDWFVISGGSVALRQMSSGIGDRHPTDVDIVIAHDDDESAAAILRDLYQCLAEMEAVGEVHDTRYHLDPREHHGFVFNNSLIETVQGPRGSGGMPIDFLTAMTTVFPDTAPIPSLRGVAHRFPTENKALYEGGDALLVNGAQVLVAPPDFVAFYKLTMNRNGHAGEGSVPKQDDLDLKRMRELGLFDGPNANGIMHVLAHGNSALLAELDDALRLKLAYD